MDSCSMRINHLIEATILTLPHGLSPITSATHSRPTPYSDTMLSAMFVIFVA